MDAWVAPVTFVGVPHLKAISHQFDPLRIGRERYVDSDHTHNRALKHVFAVHADNEHHILAIRTERDRREPSGLSGSSYATLDVACDNRYSVHTTGSWISGGAVMPPFNLAQSRPSVTAYKGGMSFKRTDSSPISAGGPH